MVTAPRDWLGDTNMWNTWLGGFILGIVIFLTVLNVWRYHGHRKRAQDGYRGASPTTADNPRAVPVSPPREGAGEATGTSARQDLNARVSGLTRYGDRLDTIPDYIEAIIGMRAWELSGTTTLQSVTRPDLWPALQRMEAECGCHDCPKSHVPGEHCKCGIYAVTSARRMQYQGRGPFVWGGVALWGKVIEAERGYRAQYAYPTSLVLVNYPDFGKNVPIEIRRHIVRLHDGLIGDLPGAFPPEAMTHVLRQLEQRYRVPVRMGTLEEYNRMQAQDVQVDTIFRGVPAEVMRVLA